MKTKLIFYISLISVFFSLTSHGGNLPTKAQLGKCLTASAWGDYESALLFCDAASSGSKYMLACGGFGQFNQGDGYFPQTGIVWAKNLYPFPSPLMGVVINKPFFGWAMSAAQKASTQKTCASIARTVYDNLPN